MVFKSTLSKLKGFSDSVMNQFKEAEASAKGGKESVFDRVLASPKVSPKAREQVEKYREKRSGLFGEVWESILNRYFPNISKLMDMGSSVSIFRKDEETHAGEREFQTISAWTLLIPDFMLKWVTDPLAKSDLFLKVLENWPVKGKYYADKIRAKKDPDDVVSALRIIQQDFAVGTVTWPMVKGWLAK